MVFRNEKLMTQLQEMVLMLTSSSPGSLDEEGARKIAHYVNQVLVRRRTVLATPLVISPTVSPDVVEDRVASTPEERVTNADDVIRDLLDTMKSS